MSWLDERYLVTGASGFLGRALIRRLTDLGVRRIVALARNAAGLQALRVIAPGIELVVGDIADPVICARAFVGGLSGVFHLAAFKHVGLAEAHALSCVTTNVIGTLNLLCESRRLDGENAQFFAFISTDKAAQSRGVYGATKALCERLVAEFAKMDYRIRPGQLTTRYFSLRYGNVWGSTGSVATLWEPILRAGGEITVTDPDATRYFFTVDDAVDLILTHVGLGTDGLVIPKMQAIRMGDVAEACQRTWGRGTVRVTELGAGESKHETLDGVTFSDAAPPFTVEAFVNKFLRLSSKCLRPG